MAIHPLPDHLRLPNNEDPHGFARRLEDLASQHVGHGFAWYFEVSAALIRKFAPHTKVWTGEFGGFLPEVEGRIPLPLDERKEAGAFWRPFANPMPQDLAIEVRSHSGVVTKSNSRDYAAYWWTNQGFIGWRPDKEALLKKASGRNKLISSGMLPGDWPQTRMTTGEAEAMKIPAPKRPPVIMFNGEPIPTAASKRARMALAEPAAAPRTGRVALRIPDKPISEAPTPPKRGRVPLIAAKPEKPLAGRKSGGFFDEEED